MMGVHWLDGAIFLALCAIAALILWGMGRRG